MRRPTLRGKGAYFAPDYFERLGDQFLGAPGKVVGEGLGGLLRAFGLGKYELEKNSLLSKVTMDMGEEVPRISNSNKGEGFVVQHEEYIGDLLTGTGVPTTFTLSSFNLNPANPELFPWLASLAENFEEYEFRGLIFTLKTMASDVSTALSLGTMFAVCQYDIFDPPFSNKQELLDYEYANSVKVSHSMMLPIECAKKNDVLTHLYVAPGNVIPSGADSRFYNMGIVSFGTQGAPTATTPVCELWVSYEIALFKPKLTLGGDLAISELSAHFNDTVTTGWSNTHPWGSAMSASPATGSSPGFAITNATTNTLNLPPNMTEGLFLVVWSVLGTAAAVTANSPSGSNCVLKQLWNNDASTVLNTPANGVSSVVFTQSFVVSITGGFSFVNCGGATLPSAITHFDLWVTQINGNISV